MQFLCRLFFAICVFLPVALSQDVGSGSPNGTIASAFLNSYYRNGFSNLVQLPPINNVTKLGTSGYVQEFYDAAKTAGVKYALILPNTTGAGGDGQPAVFQSYPAVYSFYTQIGVTTAGYPTTDTQTCPSVVGNTCTFQIFTRPYILYAYTSPINGVSTFYTRDPFYTKWQGFGGIFGLGPTMSAETAYTSPAGNISTVQTYYQGLIANITGGNVSARIVAVKEPVWDLYASNGSYAGSMGLPLSDELRQSNGHYRQSFEAGTIDYDPNTPGSATLLLPVKTITLSPLPLGGTLKLNQGDTAIVNANAFAPDGSTLTGRVFTWNTTNGRIVSISQSNTSSVTIKAVGGGEANITASSEGATSTNLKIFVTAPCCAVGEGAPTTSLQQSFQDAIVRNRLTPKLPAASPVTRIGTGYIQQFQTADTGDPFWIAASQSTASAYLIRGVLLSEYQARGGPGGALGYPFGDPTAGGRQNFETGALAGNPVRLVSGAILSKWALLGYETGSAGSPTGDATPFVTFRATSGTSQAFKNASLFLISSGAQAGQVISVAGPILAAYTGPTSDLGAPTNDEIGLNGLRHQDFEGGYFEYAPGETVARVVPSPHVPTVTATPTSTPAGGIVRLAIGGFDAGTQVRVSVTGQPDFITTLPTGSYIWESYIPVNATSSTVTVKAVDTKSQAASQASYSIRGGNAARLSLKALRGDAQTGIPGAILPIKIQILYTDDLGYPIPNATVHFNPSPGGEILNAAAVTDENGMASASWRLPPEEGVALLSVSANAHLLNMSARSVHSGLVNFPVISQAGIATPLGNGTDPISSKGALLVSAAAVIRYYQNRGDVPAPAGLADPVTLNAHLKSACVTDPTGAQNCDGFLQPTESNDQIVNLWRLPGFVAGGLSIQTLPVSDAQTYDKPVRDAIAQGNPAILALTLSVNGTAPVAHFVVATGVDGGGNLTIMDPNPAYGQTTMYGYLNGFQNRAGAMVTGTVTGAIVVRPQAPAAPGFLVAVSAPVAVQSPGGICGGAFVFPIANTVFALQYCDGTDSQVYELDVNGAANFQGSFIDLGSSAVRANLSGGGSAFFSLDQSSGQWVVAPLTAQFQASGVVNSASHTGDLAPGGLASIIGSGLSSANSQTVIAVNGEYAPLIQATPFRLDFQIPADAVPGPATLDVVTDLTGSAEQTVTLKAVAPAIQLLGIRRGRVLNQDGSANSRYRAASRGQSVNVFGTGFGAVTASGALATPVRAFIAGTEVKVTSVTADPNTPGLYQVTLAIPPTLPPGLAQELVLQQSDSMSNAVDVAIQ